MRRVLVLLSAVALGLACGDDGSGPSSGSFAGTYPGEFYAIFSSTSPVERDSINGGAVTLSLVSTGGDSYTISATTPTETVSAPVNLNGAGAMTFPNFDEAGTVALAGSLLEGICTLTDAHATPSGSLVNQRLTFTLLVSGAACYWSGNFTDTRPTLVQLTWTALIPTIVLPRISAIA